MIKFEKWGESIYGSFLVYLISVSATSSTILLTKLIVVGASRTPTRMLKCMHQTPKTTNHLKDLKRSGQAGPASPSNEALIGREKQREAPESFSG